MRQVVEKRLEWGLPTFKVKLDIAKAYDSVAWAAICWLFERRGLPDFLRAACWRMHTGRELHFGTGDNVAEFALIPERWMPQGAPESPLVFATLVEDMLVVAKAVLTTSNLPRGVRLPDPEAERDRYDVAACNTHSRITEHDVSLCNFADDTYILAESAFATSHSISVVSRELARANQSLAGDKSECLAAPAIDHP